MSGVLAGRAAPGPARATRARAPWSFGIFVADLLGKKWMESIVPALLCALAALALSAAVPHFATAATFASLSREYGEIALLAIGETVVLVSGGIDISIGSAFALSNVFALILLRLVGAPVAAAGVATLALGALLGALNGAPIGALKVNPLLTTLVTLIVYRGVVTLLDVRLGGALARASFTDPTWAFLGHGSIAGVPTSVWVLGVVALAVHGVLSRSRFGWQLTAVGGDRRSARHAGIEVDRLRASAYVASGVLAALAGLLFAARLGSGSARTGEGLEFTVLTAVVVGGVSLLGGRGTIPRALIGSATVMMLSRGLLLLNAGSEVQQLVLAVVLLAAVGFDVKFMKHRWSFIQKIYIRPASIEYPPLPEFTGAWAPNQRLRGAEAIGLDRIEGPEDVILDRQGRVYAGTREGEIVRFGGGDFREREVFARVGGRPLGLAFDDDDHLVVCIGGMGLYAVAPDRAVRCLTDRTRRSLFRLIDDSRLRLADDCDVDRLDGSIYFSEATLRFEMETWILDCIEGRPNGRLVRYDPKTGRTETVLEDVIFPNGVCVSHDGQSVLFCRTWACDVQRLWIRGAKRGTLEPFGPSLPGYPDNVNKASHGRYWLALTGMRTPSFDLMMRLPGVRRRMMKRIPPQEWLYPNVNNGLVVLLSADGEPLETYWDPTGREHPNITSMREHDGWLYLGGLNNNRIGRIRLGEAGERDPSRGRPEEAGAPA
ncbi:MAG: SMP-30/gluconolactonase/LRE family protein [Deltaproteobacteria bacterium]|nr:SMP-30/gluconolactonase/LRE family protein [Deltaproteobacteria bacterium]